MRRNIITEKKFWIVLFGLIILHAHPLQAQLDLVSSHNIDFSNAVLSVKSGNWNDPTLWSNGQVPTATTDVIINNNHNVYIDKQGASSNQIVDLCRNLKIKQSARLSMGHNTSNFSKDLRINGSILCNGTFSSGRSQPSGSGDGSLYSFNSRIYLQLNADDTYISGSGYFHPRTININGGSGVNNVIVDIYNMVLDQNFVVKSDIRVNVTIERYSYMNIKGVLGLTGSTWQWSIPTAKADLSIKGIVVSNDVSLFTKNTTPGESSSLTIEGEGILFTQKINNGETTRKAAEGGFDFTIKSGGLFKLGLGVNFSSLTSSNPNFSLIENGEVREHYSTDTTTKNQLSSIIDAYDPNLGANVPQIKDVFGASHIAGWYNFTDKPFMVEGLDTFKSFGSTALKTTLSATNGKMFSAYPFNHTWPSFQTLRDVAQHQYIDSLFKRTHIKTHAFWTTTRNKGDYKQGPDFDHQSYLNEEQQFYDLTKHLLDTYGSMDKTFLYQNWEGDWMLRGSVKGTIWENDPTQIPDDIDWMTSGMARMFRARQRGTERARNEYNGLNAKVFHGIEFNKMWFQINGAHIRINEHGTPSVIANVIPHTRIDVSSWSAYDAGWNNSANPHGHSMWKGLKTAAYFTNSTGEIDGFPVQIGEFAINENPPYNGANNKARIRERYGRYIGVALSLGVPQFYLWNLYCSGQQGGPDGFTWQKGVQYQESFLYEWMDGKWLIEPDGSWGHAAEFLMEQWESSLSTNKFHLNDTIKIFPNPTTGTITIEGIENKSAGIVYDITGKIVQRVTAYQNQPLALKNLNPGLYFVKIKNKNKLTITKKLIIN